MAAPTKIRTKILFSLALCGAAFQAFRPVLSADFLNFDDPLYVTGEPRISEGLNLSNVIWALTHPHPASNWQPLTTISYMADVRLFGADALGHHLVNLLIHMANAVLLLWIMTRLTGAVWRSVIIAGLFALHPMNVEPVAWISSRKDVLCMFFFLLSIWFYVCYASKEGSGNERAGKQMGLCYLLALGCFIAALMSKATVVTLPFVLLLLDYWPLRRLKSSTRFSEQLRSIWPLIREKLPFFILSAVFSWLGSYLLRKEGGTQNYGDLALSNRAANGIVSYARYVEKAVWPTDLSVFYPRPSHWAVWQVMLSFVLILGCTVIAVAYARRRPYLFVGWFWFVGTLLPVVGIIHQLGGHAMADRYAYIAFPGLFILMTFAAAELLWRNEPGKILTAVGVLAVLFALTRTEVRYWQDSEALFRHAVAVDKDNAAAHNLLGNALLDQGRVKEAEEHLAESLRIRPDFPYAVINYAMALARDGRIDEGATKLSELLKRHPADEDVHYTLGLILQQKGDVPGAIKEYQEAVRLKPDDADALNNLAWIRAANAEAVYRNGEEAVRYAKQACESTRFQKPVVMGTLAAAYAEAGQFKEAIAMAEKAQAVARELGLLEIAQKNRELLELYQAGKPYHEN